MKDTECFTYQIVIGGVILISCIIGCGIGYLLIR